MTVARRAPPDAILEGYVVDGQTGRTIPNASLVLSEPETGAIGGAATDGDGSYRVALDAGYYAVMATADSYGRWEGIVQVATGNHSFDVALGPGNDAGTCCAYTGGAGNYGPRAVIPASPVAPLEMTPPGWFTRGGFRVSAPGAGATNAANGFQDLGGGLGPPGASPQSPPRGTPGPVLLPIGVALGAALRRRTQSR
ncbi:MAG: carboxypeptidase-like regulatory domain-containing protein [Thermoplasmatota archaeon]